MLGENQERGTQHIRRKSRWEDNIKKIRFCWRTLVKIIMKAAFYKGRRT